MGWNTRNPNRDPNGQIYTQQECLDVEDIKLALGRQRPEYVIKVRENKFWVIEAKGEHSLLRQAFNEALDYANQINKNVNTLVSIISGVAGNDIDGYLIKTAIVYKNGTYEYITYNDHAITALLSVEQARHIIDNQTCKLNELVTDEKLLLSIAEKTNEELHKASINKDIRASVMSSVLLSMLSDTLPNFDASPIVFVKDINNRAEDVLIEHSKREFAEQIELKLPHEEAAQLKFKQALIKVFFLLRKINIKAAMNGGQDLLGKFYEVFLKYGNGAKDIGIVLTPRHITRFACKILDITSQDIIFDPACGTGGFLVAAYDKVRVEDPDSLPHFKKHKIFGVEQQASIASLAIVNMIFRGDGKNNIINDDCFAISLNRKTRNGDLSAEYVSNTYQNRRPPVTKVLMNPPFALKKDDEKEFKFIDHALQQMTKNGLLFAVLPISVMYSGKMYLSWRRKMLEENTLLSVISFPNELFYPQASVEPIAIIIRKGIQHDLKQKVAWARIENDGFKKWKKRRLPLYGENQLDTFDIKLRNFLLEDVLSEDLIGELQFKEINYNDLELELIPASYLDNKSMSNTIIMNEMKKNFSELIFQGIKKKLQDDNIELI